MAMMVVVVAKMASGIETITRTEGANAYIGFHMVKLTLKEPTRNIVVGEAYAWEWRCRESCWGRHVKGCGDAKLGHVAHPSMPVNNNLAQLHNVFFLGHRHWVSVLHSDISSFARNRMNPITRLLAVSVRPESPGSSPSGSHTDSKEHCTERRALEDALVLLNLKPGAVRLALDAEEGAAGNQQPCAEEDFVSVLWQWMLRVLVGHDAEVK
jgi:hypothetical protein